MSKKIVRRVSVGSTSPTDDFIALIDLIELQLDIATGCRTLSDRLSQVVSSVRSSNGVVSPEQLSVLIEAVERLKKLEQLLSDSGFKTRSETPVE
jgi:hypothetical protein